MQQYLHSFACMGTVVTMQTICPDDSADRMRLRDDALARATVWFREVEQCCNRFDESSELRRLCSHSNTPVTVSELLFECLHFAVAVAAASNGAFDPTVGARMEQRGFDRDYRTGARIEHSLRDSRATYKDIELHEPTRTVTLRKPLQLDLGAVAKGLAIDLAVRELHELADFMIDAGGDLYLSGLNAERLPWTVGVRHPRVTGEFIHTLQVSDTAVCTSGDYERVANDATGHILNATRDEPASALASVTVIAPSAMVADALATAAFALGPSDGLTFLEEQQLTALLVTPQLDLLHVRSAPVE